MYSVKIKKDKCIGCGSCAEICKKIFEMKGSRAEVKISKTEDKCVINAKNLCPTQAIELKEI